MVSVESCWIFCILKGFLNLRKRLSSVLPDIKPQWGWPLLQCLSLSPSHTSPIQNKGGGAEPGEWMAMREWMDYIPLYGKVSPAYLVWIYLAFELGFSLFLTTSLRSTKNGIFSLYWKQTLRRFYLIVINSICYRMTGKFGPHFILSLLLLDFLRGKRPKIKPWRVYSSC